MFSALKTGVVATKIYALTQGSAGYGAGTAYGMENTIVAIGTIVPSTLRGLTIIDCFIHDNSAGNMDSFRVRLNTQVAQTFFESVTIEGGGTYLTASADTFLATGGTTSWDWQLGIDATIPTPWDGTGVVTVSFT